MPATSKKQFKFIQAKRSQYGSKEKAPKAWKWVFSNDWTKGVDYDKLPECEKRKKYKRTEELTSSGLGDIPETPMKKNQFNDIEEDNEIKVVNPNG